MGFFSWNCKKCDHSIKAPYEVPTGWTYMNEAVVILSSGEIIMGEYDGYGRVGTQDITWDDPEMWHKECWKNAGKPEYTGASERAQDQGYFYDDPSDEELLEAIRLTE